MRVISQSGKFDLPYEQIAVYLNENEVMCRLCGDANSRNLLGRYSSAEKSEKAMEMLRNTYLEPTYRNNLINEIAIYDMKVFRFPVDEDVEVEDE